MSTVRPTLPAKAPKLPAEALGKTNQNRGDIAAFARHFVTAELADTMPPEALATTLDIVLGLRALKGYYADYLAQLGQANVDLAHLPQYLSGSAWQALNTNQRTHLEACIAREARQINAGILKAIDFLTGQLIAVTPDETALQAMLEARIAQYPAYAPPPPVRKARRVKPAAA